MLVRPGPGFRPQSRTGLPAALTAAAATATAVAAATAATTAVAAAATRTATATRTTAAAATAAGAGTILRFIDAEGTTAHVEAVERLHGARGISLRHFDEAEAARPAGLAVGREGNGLDGAVLGEELRTSGSVAVKGRLPT